MAKLSAKTNGEEVYRLRKEEGATDMTIESYREVSIRSTRYVLAKSTWRYKPDNFDPAGRLHSPGWKQMGKMREGQTFEELKNVYLNLGYELMK